MTAKTLHPHVLRDDNFHQLASLTGTDSTGQTACACPVSLSKTDSRGLESTCATVEKPGPVPRAVALAALALLLTGCLSAETGALRSDLRELGAAIDKLDADLAAGFAELRRALQEPCACRPGGAP